MRRRDDDKERRIKEAVIQLILTEGWNGTSISKIARLAEVSPATVYVYFDSKEDMLQDIYREYSEDVYGYLLSGIRPGMRPDEMLDVLIRGYYRYIAREPQAFASSSSLPAAQRGETAQQETGRLQHYSLSSSWRGGAIRDTTARWLFAAIFYPVKPSPPTAAQPRGTRKSSLPELIDLAEQPVLYSGSRGGLVRRFMES